MEDVPTIDFSPLTDALASKSYVKIADICDELMLQVSAYSNTLLNDWPYAIHLLGHIYAGDINSARFLWKSMPLAVKESDAEVIAVWRIGQMLWTRNYSGVYDALRSFNWGSEIQPFVASFWENYTKKMFLLLVAAYSTISVQDTALFLGMSEEEVTKCKDLTKLLLYELHNNGHVRGNVTVLPVHFTDVLQEGWSLDAATRMFTVRKQSIVSEQKLDPSKLQRLTEYVFHLEH